jgi:hypothetical protein
VAPAGASLSGTIGDSVTAFGDLFPTASLRWNRGVHNVMTYVTANVPLGAYDVNRWALDAGLAIPTSMKQGARNSPPSPG